MAFPTENFNSYDDGDLNGQNGGLGWTGPWSGSIAYDVQGVTVQEGAKAVAVITNYQIINRDFTPNTEDNRIFSIYMRVSSLDDVKEDILSLQQGAAWTSVLYFNAGKIKFRNNTTWVIIADQVANQWYHFEIRINYTNKTSALRIDGGDWSPDYGFHAGAQHTQTDRIEFYHQTNAAAALFFDNIIDGSAPPPVAGKSRGHIF